MGTNQKNFWILLAVVLGLLVVYQTFVDVGGRGRGATLAYTAFQQAAEDKQIKEVVMRGDTITGKKMDGSSFMTKVPERTDVADNLARNGVKVEALPREDEGFSLFGLLLSWGPTLLFIGIWLYFYRQMQAGGSKAMGFGRSKAKLLTPRSGKVTFKDVAGIDEAKQDVEEIVDFLKDPQKFQRLGGKIPKGVLLIGSPGNGKTLLARAIAGEADVPFFSISGSDFVEMFVGVGASRVRDMFEQAKKHAPCIIFVDEIDAVGRHRGAGLGGGNDEREQTLNQLLVEMDGFEATEGIILVAATNRPDVLDPALLRPGRFDRQVVVPAPDVKGREQILLVHLKKIKAATDVEPRVLARGTPGFSGAELENLVNEGALLAARRGLRTVGMKELEEAKDKVMMGSERRSLAMSQEEKKLTAYHEAGHAIVGLCIPESDPIHKATIVPRGRALGMVMRLPEGDRFSKTNAQLKADLAMSMGGRAAEEKTFGKNKVTTGASSDIKYATELARRMVMEWGLSEKLGPLNYGPPQQEVFLGHSITQTQGMSEETAKTVDAEIRRLVEEGYARAQKILEQKADQLVLLAEALLEYETLTGEEINDLIAGKGITRLESGRLHIPKLSSLPARMVPEDGESGPLSTQEPGQEGQAGTRKKKPTKKKKSSSDSAQEPPSL